VGRIAGREALRTHPFEHQEANIVSKSMFQRLLPLFALTLDLQQLATRPMPCAIDAVQPCGQMVLVGPGLVSGEQGGEQVAHPIEKGTHGVQVGTWMQGHEIPRVDIRLRTVVDHEQRALDRPVIEQLVKQIDIGRPNRFDVAGRRMSDRVEDVKQLH
jgi:hypothetical protein